MVAYPDRFDCLCMAGSFSKRRAGEERDFCKFVVIKHLSYPVFVRAEQADKGEAGIFDWRGDGNHFQAWGKTKKSVALGSTFLALIPFQIIINVALAKMIGEPVFDIWDMLVIFVLVILAIVSYCSAFGRHLS